MKWFRHMPQTEIEQYSDNNKLCSGDISTDHVGIKEKDIWVSELEYIIL